MLATVPLLLLSGCRLVHTPVLNPQGPVALAERDLLFTVAGLMLIVVELAWTVSGYPTDAPTPGVDGVERLAALGSLARRNIHRQ